MKHSLGAILLCAVVANASAAQTLYVQSLKGNLLAQPSFSAAKVIAVQRGDQLQMLQRQGAWGMVSGHILRQTGVDAEIAAGRPAADEQDQRIYRQ